MIPHATTPKIGVEEMVTATATPLLVIDVPAAAVDTTAGVGIMITTLVETMSRIGRLLGSSSDMS